MVKLGEDSVAVVEVLVFVVFPSAFAFFSASFFAASISLFTIAAIAFCNCRSLFFFSAISF